MTFDLELGMKGLGNIPGFYQQNCALFGIL